MSFLREEKGERKGERKINVWLPLMCSLRGTWTATQACALTENGTSDPLVHRPAFNPLSHTSQGYNEPLYAQDIFGISDYFLGQMPRNEIVEYFNTFQRNHTMF